MSIYLVMEVTTHHDEHEDEPTVIESVVDMGYFTDQAEAEHVAWMLDGMSGQGLPDTPYDPTGCNRLDTFTTVHFEARKMSPVPEDYML